MAHTLTISEVRADEFFRRWKFALQEDRIVLDDKRPAVVYGPDPLLPDRRLAVTLKPAVWERFRAYFRDYLRQGWVHPARAKLCDFCGSVLKVHRELEQLWTFKCERCKTYEHWSKTFVGGTQGAGEREKT